MKWIVQALGLFVVAFLIGNAARACFVDLPAKVSEVDLLRAEVEKLKDDLHNVKCQLILQGLYKKENDIIKRK